VHHFVDGFQKFSGVISEPSKRRRPPARSARLGACSPYMYSPTCGLHTVEFLDQLLKKTGLLIATRY